MQIFHHLIASELLSKNPTSIDWTVSRLLSLLNGIRNTSEMCIENHFLTNHVICMSGMLNGDSSWVTSDQVYVVACSLPPFEYASLQLFWHVPLWFTDQQFHSGLLEWNWSVPAVVLCDSLLDVHKIKGEPLVESHEPMSDVPCIKVALILLHGCLVPHLICLPHLDYRSVWNTVMYSSHCITFLSYIYKCLFSLFFPDLASNPHCLGYHLPARPLLLPLCCRCLWAKIFSIFGPVCKLGYHVHTGPSCNRNCEFSLSSFSHSVSVKLALH